MAHEVLIKRTVYVAKCPACEWQDVKESNPPKETLCLHCNIWVKYEEVSYTGPSLKRK